MAEESSLKIIYLWSLPRSLSTAFLRAMSTIEGCKGFHEPYLPAFYGEHKHFPDDLASLFPTESYDQARDRLQGSYPGHKMLFIKEMAKHLVGKLQDRSYIPETATHTFLIRHPVKTIQSFLSTAMKAFKDFDTDDAKREEAMAMMFNVDTMRAEQSYEFLTTLHEFITQEYKHKSIIIDADDLQANPEGTMRAYCQEVGMEYHDSLVNWGPITPEQKEIWKFELAFPPLMHFIGGAVNGTGFIKGEPRKAKIEDLKKPYQSLVADNMPMYEKLYNLRLKPL